MYLIKNATIVNEGSVKMLDVRINAKGIIEKIDSDISHKNQEQIIDAGGLHLLPGMIDDQVHFREPGLSNKADIGTESAAAVAGGITSFMEMPNTSPPSITNTILEEKYQIAAKTSHANYSFYLGATNDNLEEIKKVDVKNVCGVKIFMGSSTGNMLVDREESLYQIFKNSPKIITTHCEKQDIIEKKLNELKNKNHNFSIADHPIIRSREACYESSKQAIELAKHTDARLHILHLTTKEEIELFSNSIDYKNKKITAEVCTHHLWFSKEDYERLGNLIKCNPAIKDQADRDALRNAIKNNFIDIIATDHAPHTFAEKQQDYLQAPAGVPQVQHALLSLIDLYHQGVFSLEEIVQKTSHNPAIIFGVENRGYIKEGYWADLVLLNLSKPYLDTQDKILYKCKWSAWEQHQFKSNIEKTFINGKLAFSDGKVTPNILGSRLTFNR